jgi:hypothetical protein
MAHRSLRLFALCAMLGLVPGGLQFVSWQSTGIPPRQ